MQPFFVDKNIAKASTLPSSFYTSEKNFKFFKEGVFRRSWQFIGSAGLVSSSRNVVPLKILEGYLDEPILLTSDDTGKLHCVSNVCTHRGYLVASHPGKQRRLQCGYHGRKFRLDGRFESMPEFDQTENFPAPCDNLPKVSFEQWHQFLFACPNPAFKFESVMQAMENKVGFLPLGAFKYNQAMSREYLVKSHWALYCDNFLEGFHIPFVHSNLNEAIEYGSYETVLHDYCSLQVGYSKSGTEIFNLPENHPDYGKDVAAYYFWLFPNMMFNFYPWGLSINIVKPLSKGLTKVSFQSYLYDETKIDQSAGALLDKVEREDEEVVEGVQKGMHSFFYNQGRYSPTKEKGVHHFHRLLAKFSQSKTSD